MRKFSAVFRNELTKIFHKKFLYILFLLMLLGMLAIGGIFKSIISGNRDTASPVPTAEEIEKELQDTRAQLQEQIAAAKTRIENFSHSKSSVDQNQAAGASDELNYLTNELFFVNLEIEKGISDYAPQYLIESLQELRDLLLLQQFRIHQSETQSEKPDANSQNAVQQVAAFDFPSDFLSEYGLPIYSNSMHLSDAEIVERIAFLETVLAEKDYGNYIQYNIKQIENDTSLSATQKDFAISDLELELKYNPDGSKDPLHFSDLGYWQDVRDQALQRLENKYDENFTPFTEAELAQLENTLENTLQILQDLTGSPTFPYRDILQLLSLIISLCTYGILFILIIIGGNTVSQEITSGSIKGLIISPVKRYKIFAAKLAALLFTAVISILLAYLAILLFIVLFFPQLFSFSISGLPAALYLFYIYLSKLSFLSMAACTALLFSTTLNSTSIAVGTSMIIYLGLQGIYHFFKMITMDMHAVFSFLPFEYLDLTKYIFPSTTVENPTFFFGSFNKDFFALQVPSYFPYVYWGLLLLMIIGTAYHAFVHKDI